MYAIPVFSFRYKLPIVFIVMNNSGIAFGADADTFKALSDSADPTLRYVIQSSACTIAELLDV